MSAGSRVEGAAAVVLAGGRSSRMGTDKALLDFDGAPLVERIVAALSRRFLEVVVVAAPGQRLPPMAATTVVDEIPHQGPLGGLYYGLRAADAGIAFVTACDAPLLQLDLVVHLVARAAGHDVVLPRWRDRDQPVHAVYRRSVVPVIGELLAAGRLRPAELFARVRTCRIGEDEIRRFDPDGASFFNVNTPADYREALQRWREARGAAPPP